MVRSLDPCGRHPPGNTPTRGWTTKKDQKFTPENVNWSHQQILVRLGENRSLS